VGARAPPDAVEDYSIEHLTGDLVALLDHLKIDKAIFVGHDWGGFIVWQMPLRHRDRVAGVVGVNTPHTDRAPVDPLLIYKKRFGETMYIVQFQDPAHEPDRIFGDNVDKAFDFFMRKPMPRKHANVGEAPVGGIGASSKTNLAFPQMVAAYDPAKDPRQKILSDEEKKIFVDAFKESGFTGGINWYRNMSGNWARAEGLDHTVRVPSLMIMAENDAVLPPSSADGMENIISDLEKYLVKDSGHWTQQEKPDEVSQVLIDWRRRRFG
jgi:pimeloyl-ACP methyl ester carboxylesterase